MSERDPMRLLDPRSELHPSLRALLEHGRSELPRAEQLAAIAQRLGPELMGPAPAPAGGAASELLSLVSVGLVLAGLGAVGYWAVAHPRVQSTPHAVQWTPTLVVDAPASAAPNITAAQRASTATAPPAVVPNAKPPAVPIREPRSAVVRARATARERNAAVANDPVAELALLDAAQRALHALPERALAYATMHAARYPHGQFEQEREIIAIEALLELGRTAAAERRAAGFAARFPGSGYAERAREQLQRARARK